MLRLLRLLRVCCVVGLVFVLLACRSESGTPALRGPGELAKGPVVARVGEVELRVDDVESLAQAARSLRRSFDLPVAEGVSDLELALELMVLAEAARLQGGDSSGEVQEGRRRLLSRLYLGRLMETLPEVPFSDAELQGLLNLEMARYAQSAESEVYRPTRLSSAMIFIGHLPGALPSDEYPVLLYDAQVEDLADKIHSACAPRVDDLDDFMALGRRFSEAHPTVRVEGFDAQSFPPAELEGVRWKALRALDGNGAISRPLRVPGGMIVIRRGATLEGQGETLADARVDLERLAIVERKRSLLKQALRAIHERLGVEIFSSRIMPDRALVAPAEPDGA